MSSLEIIDDKNFTIRYNESFYGDKQFSHMFCNWTAKTVFENGGNRFRISLTCKANDSNLWTVGARVLFTFIKSDGTKGYVEKIDMKYQADDTIVINESFLMKKQYRNIESKSIRCDIKVRILSISGLPYKTHDFTKMDENVNNTALVVEGKKLYVSKQILAMASPVFHAMFYSGFKESKDEEIPIGDVKYDEFEQFLQLIYGNNVNIDAENIDALLTLADCYDVDNLKTKFEDWLMSNSEHDPAEKLILAEKFTLSRLQSKTLNTLKTSQLNTFCDNNKQFGEATVRVLAKHLAKRTRHL